MNSMRIAGFVFFTGVVVLGACKGKVEYKDTQETLDKVAGLESQLKDKDTYLQKLRDENAELKRGGDATVPGDNEWVFTIVGDALTLTAKPTHGGGGGGTPDDATATALGNSFFEMVQKSRGPIQKCYELALKKSNALATRTVNLKVVASFAASGQFKQVSFSPDLPAGFDSCLRDVASKWKMTEAKSSGTYQASLKLTPT